MTLLPSPSVPHPDRTDALSARFGRRLAVAMAFGVVASAADLAGGAAPLALATLLILGIGLPHGASDHLVAMGGRSPLAAPGRLALFLVLYLGAVVATLVLWHAKPGLALSAFLLLSAIHFGLDDIPGEPWHRRVPERLARGLMPLCLPALWHFETLAGLFGRLSTPADGEALAALAAGLAPFVAGLALISALDRLRRGEVEQSAELVLSGLALVLFSPLVGFALVFALVHSRGQTRERIADLRLPGLQAYLHACLPTLLGAAAFFLMLTALFAGGRAPALGALFIGLSALTVPHMSVTPLFKNR